MKAHGIDLFFESFRNDNFDKFGESIGVYVIWDLEHKELIYIGRGKITNRLSKFPKERGYFSSLNGYAAVLDDSSQPEKDAETVETTLLCIFAYRTDGEKPYFNDKSGDKKDLRKFLKKGNEIRINLSVGYDSFAWPPRKVNQNQKYTWLSNDNEIINIGHYWRRNSPEFQFHV